MIALGVTTTGEKRILGLVQTATENKRVIASFVRQLGERGFPLEGPLLVVLDGAKGLRVAVREIYGESVAVQRCQWHKRENVVSYLPKREQPTWRRKLQAAYAHRPTRMPSVLSCGWYASSSPRTNRRRGAWRKDLRRP